MDKKKAIKRVKQYTQALSRKIKVDDVIIYGSLLTKNFKESSDIDIIVLSPVFQRYSADQRLRLLYRNAIGFPYNLHVYGLTKKELEKAPKLSIIYSIRKHGKSLKTL